MTLQLEFGGQNMGFGNCQGSKPFFNDQMEPMISIFPTHYPAPWKVHHGVYYLLFNKCVVIFLPPLSLVGCDNSLLYDTLLLLVNLNVVNYWWLWHKFLSLVISCRGGGRIYVSEMWKIKTSNTIWMFTTLMT